jgi:hypothetical protein
MNPSELSEADKRYLWELLALLRKADTKIMGMGITALDTDWKQLRDGLHDTISALDRLAQRLHPR